MKVAKKSVVGLEYSLHLGDGEIIDHSEPGEPLTYIQGEGQIVPGLETALEGMEVGEAKSVVVSPGEGYGEHNPRGIQEVPRTAFPTDLIPKPGMELMAQAPDGGAMPLVVREVKKDTVVIDLNHPLAGKTLHFSVKVCSVRPATAEELEHGHAHGPEGHHLH